MTKRELIEALEASPAPDDAKVEFLTEEGVNEEISELCYHECTNRLELL